MSEIKTPVTYEPRNCIIRDGDGKEIARTSFAGYDSAIAHALGRQIADALNASPSRESDRIAQEKI